LWTQTLLRTPRGLLSSLLPRNVQSSFREKFQSMLDSIATASAISGFIAPESARRMPSLTATPESPTSAYFQRFPPARTKAK
jgi:hypothetical protein